jgi:hypothetical protein
MAKKSNSCLVTFTAGCGCGWSYGPGIQTDVLQMVKFHRSKGCDDSSDSARKETAA